MKKFVSLGSLNAFLAVAMGAFGAHALKSILSADKLSTWQTGVTYQFYHALGLIIIGLLAKACPDSAMIRTAGWVMCTGIILFSGSLYLLSLSGLTSLGMITPFGGFAFLLSWLLLVFGVLRS
ncbi:MAG: DUF423 domain-containing protein [Deltaproteobacteria bacterium]|nr:DUF423 domain-containing protein [Deltaproteobacteria bacterium]